MEEKTVPLTFLQPYRQGKITMIQGGYRFKQRMRSMGICDGKVVTIKSKQPFHGPLTIEVCGTQMTIGRGMAHKIQVEIID
jgi:Fe2+ transport system protein FeoA